MKSRFRKNVEHPKLTPVHSPDDSEYAVDDYMTIPLPIDKPSKTKTDPFPPSLLGKKKINDLMTETRVESMDTPISSNSKGYQLLQKFGGYSGEGGLGKSNQGLPAPLRVEKYDKDRSGIGICDHPGILSNKFKSSVVNKKQKASEQEEKFQTMSTDYRSNINEALNSKKALSDVRKAESVIYELDTKFSISVHELWPLSMQPKLLINDADHDVESESKIANDLVLQDSIYKDSIIRATSSDDNDAYADKSERSKEEEKEKEESNHFGIVSEIEYEDIDDIYVSTSSRKHNDVRTSSTTNDSAEIIVTNEDVQDRLNRCIEYLRNIHHYCLYCGCQYSSDKELESFCPGITSDDH